MTEEYKQYMSRGREAFVAQDYRKSFEYFNAALELVKDLKEGDDTKQHYYWTQECVFDALEKMQDYKHAIQRIDRVIEEEKAKGDSVTQKHLAHFMQRKACLEIKSGNNRPGVKLAGEAYEMGWKNKEQKTNYEVAAQIWNEHQRGSKITEEWIDYWQKNFNYFVADKELPI
jgi:tetratricopeptide (TPR) repeat protein